MIHMYAKNVYKRDVTCYWPPCHKLPHLLGPPPLLERDVLYGRPLSPSAVRDPTISFNASPSAL